MGGNLSSTNPNSTTTETTSATMPSSSSPPVHESEPQSEPKSTLPETQAEVQGSLDSSSETFPEDLEVKQGGTVPEGKVEEEEGECGFCLFMKGGGCREVFIEWEKCVEEGEEKKEDIVEKCFEITANLKKCMEANADYYGPLLQAEKVAQEEAMKELEKEKESEQEKESEKGIEESGAGKF